MAYNNIGYLFDICHNYQVNKHEGSGVMAYSIVLSVNQSKSQVTWVSEQEQEYKSCQGSKEVCLSDLAYFHSLRCQQTGKISNSPTKNNFLTQVGEFSLLGRHTLLKEFSYVAQCNAVQTWRNGKALMPRLFASAEENLLETSPVCQHLYWC